jgi:SAM-dependent methyltransferase
VLRWRFGSLAEVGSFLDFAAGFGRSTRFTVTDLPPERVWAAEIQQDALEALRAELGVHVLASPAHPSAFAPGRTFDAIFVSSLFTHLPEPAFAEWLSTLAALVEPRGVLVLSTHDMSLANEPPSSAGFLFQLQSESGKLAVSQYGSTFVTEEYVGRTLARLLPGWSWRRFPRGLVARQDLYVLTPERECDFSSLELPRTFDHAIDYFDVNLAGGLRCIGWLADREQGVTPVRVELLVEDGGRASCGQASPAPRGDVAIAVGVAAPAWGYDVVVQLPVDWNPEAGVRLECTLGDGRRALVWESTLFDALLRSARLQLIYLAARSAPQDSGAPAPASADRPAPSTARQPTLAPRDWWRRWIGALGRRLAALGDT